MDEPSKIKKDTSKKRRIDAIDELTNIEEEALTNIPVWLRGSDEYEDDNHIENYDYSSNFDKRDQGILKKAVFCGLSATIMSILCYAVFNEIVFVVVSGFLFTITLLLMNVFRHPQKGNFENYESYDLKNLLEEWDKLDQIEKIE